MYIYVGNLSAQTVGVDLRREFEVFGEVTKAAVIKDQAKTTSAGFGCVKMANQVGTDAALSGMVGKAMHGRTWDIRKTRQVPDPEPDEKK